MIGMGVSAGVGLAVGAGVFMGSGVAVGGGSGVFVAAVVGVGAGSRSPCGKKEARNAPRLVRANFAKSRREIIGSATEGRVLRGMYC